MPAKKHPVVLTAEEHSTLQKAARSNKRSCLERRRARILLASAEGQSDAAIAATRINWRFTTADARSKLKHLYPQTLPC